MADPVDELRERIAQAIRDEMPATGEYEAQPAEELVAEFTDAVMAALRGHIPDTLRFPSEIPGLRERIVDATHDGPHHFDYPEDREEMADAVIAALGLEQVGWRRKDEAPLTVEAVYRLSPREEQT